MLATQDMLSLFYSFMMDVSVFHQQTGKVARIRENYSAVCGKQPPTEVQKVSF